MSKPLGALLLTTFIIMVALMGTDRTTAVSERLQPASPPGTFVVRISYNEISDLQKLTAFDVWEYNNLEEHYVLAALTAADYVQLEKSGWKLQIDLEATAQIQDENLRPFQNGYQTVDELLSELEGLNNQYPKLSELVTYGKGTCLAQDGCTTPGGDFLPGYPLRALRISNEEIPGVSTIGESGIDQGSKPVFFLLANIHARELTTSELSMRLINWLLKEYGHDADATWLVDWHEIWIIPTANPEGHWLVELGSSEAYGEVPFYQRKNLNNDVDHDDIPDCGMWPPSAGWQYGVDLNRNHTVGWGPPGSSAEPCSQTFRGTAPTSETETAALQNLISQLIPDQRGPSMEDLAPLDTMGILLTLHSYSGLILRPWAYTNDLAPNAEGLKAIADKMATYNGYLSCQPGSCLYEANGTTDDWAYGELGIPAFTFEIGDDFIPPYSVIDAVQWPENQPAFLYAAKIARSPYQTVLGPNATQVEAVFNSKTDQIIISATIDDSEHGAQFVSAAQLAVDTPFWSADALPHPLAAVDGTYNNEQEAVTATVDAGETAPGQHIVFVRGQDDQGNWGITSAAFVNITAHTQFSSFMPFAAFSPLTG